MASKYVIATTGGYVDLKFPAGITRQYIRQGHRYLASEAVVKRHPELFAPLKPATPTQTAA